MELTIIVHRTVRTRLTLCRKAGWNIQKYGCRCNQSSINSHGIVERFDGTSRLSQSSCHIKRAGSGSVVVNRSHHRKNFTSGWSGYQEGAIAHI